MDQGERKIFFRRQGAIPVQDGQVDVLVDLV